MSYESVRAGLNPLHIFRLGEASATHFNTGSDTGPDLDILVSAAGYDQPSLVPTIKDNGSRLYNGTNTRTQGASTNESDVLSLEVWVNFNALPALNAEMAMLHFKASAGTNTNGAFLLRANHTAGGSTFMEALFADPVTDNLRYGERGTTIISTGATYHVIATFDGTSTVIVYVNGVNDGASAHENYTGGTMDVLAVNSQGGGGQEVNGTIDEVALYSTTLTPAQVASLFAAGTSSGRNPTLIPGLGFGLID